MAMPTKDTLLVPWGANFDARATASPVTFSLTAPQALSFHTAYQAYADAYTALVNARLAGHRIQSLTTTKDTAKANLLKIGRELYAIVQSAIGVSDADKNDVGVVVKKTNTTPIDPPADPPRISIVSVRTNTVKLQLSDATRPGKRAKPASADGAQIFSFIGPVAPSDESAWRSEGLTGRSVVDIVFPASTAGGTKVWFTAFWFSRNKRNSPATEPVGTNLQGGGAMVA